MITGVIESIGSVSMFGGTIGSIGSVGMIGGMIGGMVWGIGSRSKIRGVVGGEGKGAIRGRITRVVAAATSLGKGGHFSKRE